MNKNKKIIVYSISITVILLIILGTYRYFVINSANNYTQQIRQQIEGAGINNISGIVKSVEGSGLKILASVPESYSLFSAGGTAYVEKEFLLKILPDSQMYSSEMRTDGEYLTKIDSISNIKINTPVSAIVKENIFKNNELSVAELFINK